MAGPNGKLPGRIFSKRLINFETFFYYSGVEKMIKWKKFLAATAIVAIASYVINAVFGYYFNSLYDPVSGLWKAMYTPSWLQDAILADVIVAILSVFAYALVNTGLGKKSDITKKGLKFGLLLCLVKDTPRVTLAYSLMPIPSTILWVWVMSGFALSLFSGMIISAIYK